MKPLRWKMWVFPCQTGILLKSTRIPRRFLRRELETSWGSEPDSLLFRFGVLAVVSSWLEEVVSTIHFSNKSRCFCEKCWETTSFLTSRGSSFKRSRTFLSILFSHLAAGASEVSPKDLGGDLLGAAAGFAALAWDFALAWRLGRWVPSFFPSDVRTAISYFCRDRGSAKISRAWYTKWKASLLPPLSGCTCKARFLKANLMSSRLALGSTRSTSYNDCIIAVHHSRGLHCMSGKWLWYIWKCGTRYSSSCILLLEMLPTGG